MFALEILSLLTVSTHLSEAAPTTFFLEGKKKQLVKKTVSLFVGG